MEAPMSSWRRSLARMAIESSHHRRCKWSQSPTETWQGELNPTLPTLDASFCRSAAMYYFVVPWWPPLLEPLLMFAPCRTHVMLRLPCPYNMMSPHESDRTCFWLFEPFGTFDTTILFRVMSAPSACTSPGTFLETSPTERARRSFKRH